MFVKDVKRRYRVIAAVKKISLQEAQDRKLFGPVWHGTSSEARERIEREGFKVFIGKPRSGDVSHGYLTGDYFEGRPAPIHHLGFGLYFTTSKTNAKSYNNGSMGGLKTYYLDVPRIETINFGAPRTMMKWWLENGYDIKPVYPLKDLSDSEVEDLRLEATKHLTDALKSKYDAVWFKGKGLRRLLDGDQICVFDPSRIYEIDLTLAKEGDVGSKVKRKSDGMIGTLLRKREIGDEYKKFHKDANYFLTVKWQKGGTDLNVYDIDVEPVGTQKVRKVAPRKKETIDTSNLDWVDKGFIKHIKDLFEQTPNDAPLKVLEYSAKNPDYFQDAIKRFKAKDLNDLISKFLEAA